ncbi:GM23117 [Drosophila sechellia]|uniref:GM23117 n=1 Tax=Drosophila sechellia TaxID=7238 RepID=B4IIB5_DROSE|nr:GM23117 [Drosophila sechellia]
MPYKRLDKISTAKICRGWQLRPVCGAANFTRDAAKTKNTELKLIEKTQNKTQVKRTMNLDLRSYSRHWLTEFIEQYQEEECLWQPKHNDYSNHTARNKSYDRLVEKLKEVEPNPDRAMVVRKINSLRSAFRREFRKTTTKGDYATRLWYYDKLLFIADHKPKRHELGTKPKRELHISFDDEESMEFEDDSHHTATQSQHMESIIPTSPDDVEDVAATASNVVVSSQGATLSTISVTPAECVTLVKSEEHQAAEAAAAAAQAHQQLVAHAAAQTSIAAAAAQGHAVKVLEITSLDSNSQREIQQAVNHLEHHQQQLHLQQTNGQHQGVPTIQIGRDHYQPLFGNAGTTAYTTTAAPSTSHRQDDEYDAIGVNVASKLRSINATQRIVAEKLISDVLFNAQVGKRSIHSALTQ